MFIILLFTLFHNVLMLSMNYEDNEKLFRKYLTGDFFLYNIINKNYQKDEKSWIYYLSPKDIPYVHCIQNRTYTNPNNTIYNASSLEIIAHQTLAIKNNKTFYSHHPLQEGITHYKNEHYYISSFPYKCNRRNTASDFLFTNVYDGPNTLNKWVIAYFNKNSEQSYIEIISPTCSGQGCSFFSQNFPGTISDIVLHESLNNVYMIIEKKNEEKEPVYTLYNGTFSTKQKTISLSPFTLSGMNCIKKLLLLSDNLLISLTHDGLLYKIDLINKETFLIDVKGFDERDILLEDIIKNRQFPYLWLLLSKTQELYLLNFKQNKNKITFKKIANAPEAEKIWFYGDHILVKHTNVTLPLAFNVHDSTPEQYSLYALRMVLAKANEPS